MRVIICNPKSEMKRALILVTFLRIDFVQPLTLRFGQDFQVEVREFLGTYGSVSAGREKVL